MAVLAQQLLDSFDALPDAEKHRVAVEILRRIQGYADRFGKRWTPAPALVEMVKDGRRFYA